MKKGVALRKIGEALEIHANPELEDCEITNAAGYQVVPAYPLCEFRVA